MLNLHVYRQVDRCCLIVRMVRFSRMSGYFLKLWFVSYPLLDNAQFEWLSHSCLMSYSVLTNPSQLKRLISSLIFDNPIVIYAIYYIIFMIVL